MTYSSARFSGQTAFEFMFIFGIFLAALIMVTYVSYSKVLEIERQRILVEVDGVLLSVTEKINTAWLEGEGFRTNLTLPEKVNDAGYEINITSNYVSLFLGGDSYSRPIITKNVTGNLTAGAVNTLTHMGDHIRIS